MLTRQARGQAAEALACDHLRHHGLQVVARNYRCRCGELDLVMRDGAVLVFVEVRYRHDARRGTPVETVTAGKRRRLIRAARRFIQQERWDGPCRFDVVGVLDTDLDWVKDAFTADWP